MKFTRILSIAVVAMFAFAAFAVVVGNTDSSDGAEPADYSKGVYASLKGLSKADSDTFCDVEGIITDSCDVITDRLFDRDIYNSYYTTITYAFDKVDESFSLYEKKSGLTYTNGESSKVKVTNVTVTITSKNKVDLYDQYSDSFEKSCEVAAYIGVSSLDVGKTIVIKIDELTYEKSYVEEETYAAVPNTDSYIVTKTKELKSDLVKAVADVEINGKHVTLDVNNVESYTETKENTYNNDQYKDKDFYTVKISGDYNNYTDDVKITADGKSYSYSYDGDYSYIYDYYELKQIDASDDYDTLPTAPTYTYQDILPNVSSDNNTAKAAIEAKGGQCSMEYSDAESLANSVAGDCKAPSSSSDTSYVWIVIIVIVVILVIVAIIIAVKAGVFKKKSE